MFKNISLHNFRSYNQEEFTFSPELTVVSGQNGTGKTNLLEALYVLSRGHSFRVADSELLRHGSETLKIEADYSDQKRAFALHQTDDTFTKQFVINGKKYTRLTQQYLLPVVLFEPNHLLLLHGNPSLRRAYLDELCEQLYPTYSRARQQYQRALLQRNRLLKYKNSLSNQQLKDQLFVWDVSLAQHGAVIVTRRHQVVEAINKELTAIYSELADVKTSIVAHYHAHHVANFEAAEQQLLANLQSRHVVDQERGYTTVGPHRDDLAFVLDGRDVHHAASRGEVRTIVLSLKMFEITALAHIAKHPPLVLLDDVFSELDERRRAALASYATKFQTVITTTSADTSFFDPKLALHHIVL